MARRRITKNYYESELYFMQKYPSKNANDVGRKVPYHLEHAKNINVVKKKGGRNDSSNN